MRGSGGAQQQRAEQPAWRAPEPGQSTARLDRLRGAKGGGRGAAAAGGLEWVAAGASAATTGGRLGAGFALGSDSDGDDAPRALYHQAGHNQAAPSGRFQKFSQVRRAQPACI